MTHSFGRLVALSLLTMSGVALADDYFWTAPVSGSFSTPGNWTPSGPPGASDTANFNTGASTAYTVSTTITSISRLLVDNDTLSLSTFQLQATSTTLPGVSLGNNAGDVANLDLSGQLSAQQILVGAVPARRRRCPVFFQTLAPAKSTSVRAERERFTSARGRLELSSPVATPDRRERSIPPARSV